MLYLRLFWEFFKTGLFSVGGGMATIPFLSAMADKTGWFTQQQLADMIAVGESTPGPIGVNMATYVGFTTAGIPGGIVATCGIVFPSLVIITLIAGILTNFADIPAVKSAFAAIRVCVCVLIFNAIVKLWKKSVPDKGALCLFLLVFGLSVFLDVSPIVFVVVCAAAGIALTQMGVRGK